MKNLSKLIPFKSVTFQSNPLTPEDLTEKEVDTRVQVILNGYELAEKGIRKHINDISFDLNIKYKEGYTSQELIKLYNQNIGGLLDAFVS